MTSHESATTMLKGGLGTACSLFALSVNTNPVMGILYTAMGIIVPSMTVVNLYYLIKKNKMNFDDRRDQKERDKKKKEQARLHFIRKHRQKHPNKSLPSQDNSSNI